MNFNIKEWIEKLEVIQHPDTLIHEIFSNLPSRAAIGTSGQLTGTVMIDMAVRSGVKPRVFTIDTLRLFPETYKLFQEVEKKYDLVIEKIQPDFKKLDEMISENGEYLFFDSKEKQEQCCFIRKVEPNQKILETVDIWVTGLRTDQSRNRQQTPRFEIIQHGKEKREILKVSPLLNWTEQQLREYCQKNSVPTHSLLSYNQNGWFYESLGCVICTTPIGPDEPRRAGRWRWFKSDDNKECGIHTVRNKEDE